METPLTKGMGRRQFLRGAAAKATGLGLLGLRAFDARSALAQPKGTTLRVGLSDDLTTPGPSFSTGFPDLTRYLLMYDPLIDFAPDMKMRGRLATSWRQTSPTVWELRLRRGVRFHNGDSFTARDVKANVDWIMNPANRSQYRAFWGVISGVDIVDDYTVRIHNEKPFATFPNALNEYSLMFPGDYVAKVGADGFSRRPIGSGAYKFVEWVPGQRFVVEANPDYWDGRPKIDRMEIYPIKEPSTRPPAILSGSVDLIDKPPMEYIQRLHAAKDVKVVSYPTLALLTLVMNTKVKPLDDVRVRRAIHHAVNIDEMITQVLGGVGKRTIGQIVDGVPGHNPKLKPYEYSPDMARQLLKEAGYTGGGPTVKIYAPSGRYFQDIQLAEAVGGYLTKVGINAQVLPTEFATIVRGLNGNPTFDGMFMIGNAQYQLDPASPYLQYVWKDVGVYYNRADVDQLGAQALAEPNPVKRAQLYQQMEQIVWDDAYWLPLTIRVETIVMKRGVAYTPRQTEYLFLREAIFTS